MKWIRKFHAAVIPAVALVFLVALDVGAANALEDKSADISGNPTWESVRGILVADSYSCTPRRTCKQIITCEEANWYLKNCSWGGRLDRDKDGKPCESGPC